MRFFNRVFLGEVRKDSTGRASPFFEDLAQEHGDRSLVSTRTAGCRRGSLTLDFPALSRFFRPSVESGSAIRFSNQVFLGEV
jgi:hypothetical protein